MSNIKRIRIKPEIETDKSVRNGPVIKKMEWILKKTLINCLIFPCYIACANYRVFLRYHLD